MVSFFFVSVFFFAFFLGLLRDEGVDRSIVFGISFVGLGVVELLFLFLLLFSFFLLAFNVVFGISF